MRVVRTWVLAIAVLMAGCAGAPFSKGFTIEPKQPVRKDAAYIESLIAEAHAAAASGRTDGPIEVLLPPGTYHLTRPIRLGPEHSGTAEHPITIRPKGRRVVISGGRPLAGWKQDGKVWTLTIPEVAAGDWNFSSLWVNGQRAPLARMPGKGQYFHKSPGSPEIPGIEPDPRRAFSYRDGDLAAWGDLDQALVMVFHAWEASYHPVESLHPETNSVLLANQAVWPLGRWDAEQRYCIYNVQAALDRPGEWTLNRRTGEIRYLPRKGESIEDAEVIAPVLEQVLIVEGSNEAPVQYLRFEGLEFAYTNSPLIGIGRADSQAEVSTSNAVELKAARHCSFERNRFHSLSNYALRAGERCSDCLIRQNEFADLGAGGIRIGASSKPTSAFAAAEQAATRIAVDNNWLHRGGRIFPGAVGIWVGHANHIDITHNDISEFYYTAVSVGWVWGYGENVTHHNRVESNHLHHIGKRVLSDMGAIYTLGVQPGTTIRFNHIHDVHSYAYGGWGIYPDEGSSHMLIEKNLVHDTRKSAFHQHYGRENTVRNNILVHSEEAVLRLTRPEPHLSLIFEKNIVVTDSGQLFSSDGWLKGHVSADHNLYWAEGDDKALFWGKTLEQYQAEGREDGSIFADPLFRGGPKHPFRLDPASPAFALGFEPFDAAQAGLYGPKRWTRGPQRLHHEAVEQSGLAE